MKKFVFGESRFVMKDAVGEGMSNDDMAKEYLASSSTKKTNEKTKNVATEVSENLNNSGNEPGKKPLEKVTEAVLDEMFKEKLDYTNKIGKVDMEYKFGISEGFDDAGNIKKLSEGIKEGIDSDGVFEKTTDKLREVLVGENKYDLETFDSLIKGSMWGLSAFYKDYVPFMYSKQILKHAERDYDAKYGFMKKFIESDEGKSFVQDFKGAQYVVQIKEGVVSFDYKFGEDSEDFDKAYNKFAVAKKVEVKVAAKTEAEAAAKALEPVDETVDSKLEALKAHPFMRLLGIETLTKLANGKEGTGLLAMIAGMLGVEGFARDFDQFRAGLPSAEAQKALDDLTKTVRKYSKDGEKMMANGMTKDDFDKNLKDSKVFSVGSKFMGMSKQKVGIKLKDKYEIVSGKKLGVRVPIGKKLDFGQMMNCKNIFAGGQAEGKVDGLSGGANGMIYEIKHPFTLPSGTFFPVGTVMKMMDEKEKLSDDFGAKVDKPSKPVSTEKAKVPAKGDKVKPKVKNNNASKEDDTKKVDTKKKGKS